MNALAGGGSFVTLPALIAVGIPSVQANATSTIALYPGGAASAWTYYRPMEPVCGVRLPAMLAVTAMGGVAGSLLLIWTPSAAFDLMLPWLLLLATTALAFGRKLGAALRGVVQVRPAAVLLMQFVLGIYGGYFGGAVGLMMMATWSVLGENAIKSLNGPRTLLVSAANTMAALAFALAGAVRWPEGITMLLGGLVGGFAGARLGLIASPASIRVLTLTATAAITAVFFLQAYASLI